MSVPGMFEAEVDRAARRARVRGVPGVDGVDLIEVLSNHASSPDHVAGAPEQRTLVAYLVTGPAPVTWDAGTVLVLGGVRQDPSLNPVGVVWAYDAVRLAGTSASPPVAGLTGVTDADRMLVGAHVPEAFRDRALVVRTTSSGDWSRYLLQLVGPGGVGAPAGIDLPLSAAPFTFTIDCPAEDDCGAPAECVPTPGQLLPGDYLARDYDALRTRLLDRMSSLMGDWTDRSPADPAVMLVELFAAVGDRLASWQDAVAAEAYLPTARRRTSVRRHARLLNYAVHEGCSARTLLAFHTDSILTLPVHTPVTDLEPDTTTGIDRTGPLDAAELGGTVFETVEAVALAPERNALPLHAWGDPDHCLLPGASAAFVTTPAGTDPGLLAGDLVILVERPVGGAPDQGDPSHRYPVRLTSTPVGHVDPVAPGAWVWELRWGAADALRGALRVTVPGAAAPVSVALANVALADHGASVAGEQLIPPTVVAGRHRPRLPHPGLAYVDATGPATGLASRAARDTLRPDPRLARAALSLDDGQRFWSPRPDLVASGRLAPHLVVEPEPGGVARLRFGDGVTGRAPVVGATFEASYRLGGGSRGNVGPDRLRRILLSPAGADPVAGATVTVWNPLPGAGGTDPEPVDQVKALAPSGFRRQLRAVTTPDYAAVAEQHPGTQRAVARRRWSGSWFTQVVTLDPVASSAGDPVLRAEVSAALDVRRMAGIDTALEEPVYVALRLRLVACVRAGVLAAEVGSALRDVFASGLRRNGTPGFFHPDRYTFGDSLRLSDVVAAAMAVDGLAWVDLTDFARAGARPADGAASLAAGVVEIAPREVLRCDSDPSNPEHGRIEIVVRGGS